MKSVILKFPNGDKFAVPAKEIALNRTNYYAESENLGYKTNEWHEEFECSMKKDILIDWVENNMSWEDIEHCVTKIESQAPDYNILFTDATFTVEDF